MKRVCVIVNKWWELDSIIGVLLSDYAGSRGLPWPTLNRQPRPRLDATTLPPIDPNPLSRATFHFTNATVELWCISDLLEHLADVPENQSSTERKAERLPLVVAAGQPDLTIAVGTAARGVGASDNGNVVVGSRVFMFNGNPNNPHSKWIGGPFGTVIASGISPSFFGSVTSFEAPGTDQVRKYFMTAPINPAPATAVITSVDHVALGDMNVTDSNDFKVADSATIAAFTKLGTNYPIGSVETTHGVIRATCGDNFLFVSGIANGIGLFGREVLPRLYPQNTVAAHNAGVVLANMLPLVVKNI
jgi:hypothetical protein